MEIHGIHHVELYVPNQIQAVHFFRTILGFRIIATRTSDSGGPDRVSAVLRQGDARLVLTSPLTLSGDVAEHIQVHGEGIKDIALHVDDCGNAFARAVAGGAIPLVEPCELQAGPCVIVMSRIGVCGDIVHTLIERTDVGGPLLPGVTDGAHDSSPPIGIEDIDHVAIALRVGELDRWVEFYTSSLDFVVAHQDYVTTDLSGMRSVVVKTANGGVCFPLMEPLPGRIRSQIDTFVEAHNGPGAQHLALRSRDIATSVATISGEVQFLPVPAAYYDQVELRVGALGAELPILKQYGILIDRDTHGLLLQIFTKPIGIRETLFVEIIERRGSSGFGRGNIRALFEAVERAGGVRGAEA